MDMSSRPGFYEIFRGKDSGKKVTGMNGYVVEIIWLRTGGKRWAVQLEEG